MYELDKQATLGSLCNIPKWNSSGQDKVWFKICTACTSFTPIPAQWLLNNN